MTSQQSAAIQSALIALGSVAASYGVITSSQAASFGTLVPVILGAIAALVGAIWNHSSAGAGK